MESDINIGACVDLEPAPTPTPEAVPLEIYQEALQISWDELRPDLIDSLEASDEIERVDVLSLDAYDTATSGRLRLAATTVWAGESRNAELGWEIAAALVSGSDEASQPAEWEGTAIDFELSGYTWSCSAEFMRGVRDREKSRNDFEAEC